MCYAANGNRLTRTATVSGFETQTIAYAANSNKMSTFNGATVTYDGMGNLATNGGFGASLGYGYSGRLAQISTGNVGTGQYHLYLLYNGLGELARARKTAVDACGETNETYREYYHFAPDGRALHLVQEVVNRVQVDWVWIDNLPVLQFQDTYDPNGTLIGTQTTYLHPDHLGTPRIGTDANGATSWRFRSDGFGKATLSGAHNVRLRFPGQIDLAFQGINYNYFRSYDPNTGRYLESDPVGLRGGVNTYAYVGGNPIIGIDPSGLVITGTWDPAPKFNIENYGIDWRSTSLVSPSWSWWGYVKFIRLYGHANGFVNIDVNCKDDCKEWEIHDRISIAASGYFDIGPNVYAITAGLLSHNAYVGAALNISLAGGALLQAEHHFLGLAAQKAGPIISALAAHGPTAICLGSTLEQ